MLGSCFDVQSASEASARKVSFWVISWALLFPFRKDQSQLIATAPWDCWKRVGRWAVSGPGSA
jgi:hypothetical protein